MSIKKIAFIHPFQLRLQRGIEVYLWYLAAALANRGVEVDILTWSGEMGVPDYACVPGLRVLAAPKSRYFQSKFASIFYSYWLLKNDYDHVLLHFAGYGEGFSLSFARLFKDLPFSLVIHFPRSLVPHRYKEFEHWGFDRRAQHLVALTLESSREVEEWSGRKPAVIGHGVDSERFQPDLAARQKIQGELGVREDDPVLISAAALEQRKGVQWVIRALPIVKQRFPRVQYWVLGDGPYRKSLEALTIEMDLGDHVRFLGFQKEVPQFLAAADLGLLLSYGEASPVSILEFAASGLPVLTSTHPPFPELIGENWGIMVPPEDTKGLAKVIIDLLIDNKKRSEMGVAGREWMLKYHTWDGVAAQYLSLLGD